MGNDQNNQTAVLVLRHVPFEHLGYAADVLQEENIGFRYCEMGEPVSPQELRDAAGLIVMGGPMSANDPEPWVERETAVIRGAIDAGRPVLGICLGAQLVAKTLGAQVYRNRVKEIGWSEVHWTAAAASDALFAGLRSPEAIFQWHGETFTLPEGSEKLAWTRDCDNQAFRWGQIVYGLQFHPEVTPEMIEDWCRQDANCGDLQELTAPVDAYAHTESQQELCRTVFRRWVRSVIFGTVLENTPVPTKD